MTVPAPPPGGAATADRPYSAILPAGACKKKGNDAGLGCTLCFCALGSSRKRRQRCAPGGGRARRAARRREGPPWATTNRRPCRPNSHAAPHRRNRGPHGAKAKGRAARRFRLDQRRHAFFRHVRAELARAPCQGGFWTSSSFLTDFVQDRFDFFCEDWYVKFPGSLLCHARSAIKIY